MNLEGFSVEFSLGFSRVAGSLRVFLDVLLKGNSHTSTYGLSFGERCGSNDPALAGRAHVRTVKRRVDFFCLWMVWERAFCGVKRVKTRDSSKKKLLRCSYMF